MAIDSGGLAQALGILKTGYECKNIDNVISST